MDVAVLSTNESDTDVKYSFVTLMKSKCITHRHSMLLGTADLAVEGLSFNCVEVGSLIKISYRIIYSLNAFHVLIPRSSVAHAVVNLRKPQRPLIRGP